ncbi:MAG: peptidase [Bacteroidetes bacterium]|nr:peptidase [Bacteroidota bacterium]
MKLIYITVLLFAGLLTARSQGYIPAETKVWPEADKSTNIYTVEGYRHGVSFFPKARSPHVEYEAGDVLAFDKFHTNDVINTWMIRYAGQYPDIVELYEVARSFEGRPILQMTITNKKTGKHTDKAGAYFEGNRHSGEVTSSESVMWLMQFLLESYGSDQEITWLIDNRTFYLRPVNNPDGHNLYMHTAQSNRSTVRPYDNDGDGLLDEDGPDDINGDGVITQMRWKDPVNGNYIIDPADPSGRLMKMVPAGQGVYRVSSEGIDNDGDGRINEDGIGGLDLHRNYPENWRPMPGVEATGRGWTQGGAGEYPLSEIETRSVVTFLLSHPNVYIVNSMDTRVPMHLRPPSTSPSEERMYPEDLKWYRYFDELGKKITGYTRAGDVYSDYGGGSPLFGHGPDFGYWYYGSIWYGDELWDGGRLTKDYNGDGVINELDRLIWDDQENGGMAFIEWTPGKHPEYGEVECGGWDPKFFGQNAPSMHLLPWAKNQALFNLEMVKNLPKLEWGGVEAKKLKAYKSDSTDYQVSFTYRNTGQLPTALRQAHLVKIVREDRLAISFDQPEPGEKPFRIINEPTPQQGRQGGGPAQTRPGTSARTLSRNTGYTEGGKSTTVTWTIRVYGKTTLKGKASVITTRAGLLTDRDFLITLQ